MARFLFRSICLYLAIAAFLAHAGARPATLADLKGRSWEIYSQNCSPGGRFSLGRMRMHTVRLEFNAEATRSSYSYFYTEGSRVCEFREEFDHVPTDDASAFALIFRQVRPIRVTTANPSCDEVLTAERSNLPRINSYVILTDRTGRVLLETKHIEEQNRYCDLQWYLPETELMSESRPIPSIVHSRHLSPVGI